MITCNDCGLDGGAHRDGCPVGTWSVWRDPLSPASRAERDQLASTVTHQRSEIDTLRAELERLEVELFVERGMKVVQKVIDKLDADKPKVCHVCHGQGGDWEDSSKPCYECGQ